MRPIDDTVINSVLDTLKNERLFRYDCERPQDSPTALLEQRFAEIVGTKYCVAMNSCSSALFLAMLASGLKPGAHVLIPAFTFIAVPSSVVHAGATPVLVEVDENYVIDLEDLEAKITEKTTHLLLSYMRGRAPDLEKVVEICDRRGVTLIEDSAHSLGVTFGGRNTGTFGKAAAFSCQSYKLIDGGEGGLMVTDDREIAFKAMLYAGCYEQNWRKHFGISGEAGEKIDAMVNSLPAYNFRMSNLSASALLPQLDQVDARVERYNANYYYLCELLEGHPHIRLPKFHDKIRPAADSIQFELVGLSLDQVDAVQKRCAAQDLKMQIFGLAGKNARCFWHWTFFEKIYDCPRTKSLLERTADLRLRLWLEKKDIEAMADTLRSAIAEVKAAA